MQRRVTRAEQLRIRRRKAIIGVLCVLAVLVVGIVLSINLLFKVTDFRVENADRTTPANTGIYTEQQLIDATGIQVGDNLYGFPPKKNLTSCWRRCRTWMWQSSPARPPAP